MALLGVIGMMISGVAAVLSLFIQGPLWLIMLLASALVAVFVRKSTPRAK
ncbi:hypothetical protein KBB17_04165 [Candidatus Saccharibacteria bacterium]|nr:hypothetical protein [Candidatus Saccharibacteria bacterium]MBP7018670.1 hypothetical protein [Candidatus Saccharibacteria bacterium]MBP9131680.1 hypothetical protein [Candidatus Saccharibacteria bacterium]